MLLMRRSRDRLSMRSSSHRREGEMPIMIENGQITGFRVDLKVTFVLD